ncbi:hypothetical protein CISG_01047 [Coccidioides immitis RMSCC 3703]|uniref:Uncharacterized protein n=1 Tax=Coccidioides immitis RMSCC 3703 TaxID=454286 RepID=A0A0J8QY60_COCIT|nr:hypothetical protein CISG_01047 [Coccidioides immitis RMSCC 3703]
MCHTALPLHPGRVLTTFGALSAVVEVLNAIGVAYIANKSLPENLRELGEALIKASLITQIVVISLFYFLAGIFHQRTAKAKVNVRSVMAPVRYEWYFYVFEASLLLLNSFLWNWRHQGASFPKVPRSISHKMAPQKSKGLAGMITARC